MTSQNPEKVQLEIHGWKEHNEKVWRLLKKDQESQKKKTLLTLWFWFSCWEKSRNISNTQR